MQKRHIKHLGMDFTPLGIGAMRLPNEDGELTKEAYRLVELAMDLGVNYFDTAYLYHSGCEEAFLHEALVKRYTRDSFLIADKLPVWLCHSRDDMERIFQEQLKRLGVDYIDIYLLHALRKPLWQQAYEHGVLDFLDDKRKSGQIRKTGFSFHGTADMFPIIVDAYGWDIVQLQINYYDWMIHDIKQCYEYSDSKNIPVAVMEPLGGGRLVRLPKKAENELRDADPSASMASWGLRFCASLPNVAIVLSGIRSENELRENISCFEPLVPYSEDEYRSVENAVSLFQSAETIPCSACRYCVDACPVKIDIPYVLQQYNDYKLFESSVALTFAYLALVPTERKADRCIGCDKCKHLCPQKINISDALAKLHEEAVLLTVFRNDVCCKEKLMSVINDKLVVFGGGNLGRFAAQYTRNIGFKELYFCDNNSSLWGTVIESVPVISPKQLADMYKEGNISIVIANLNYYDQISDQLSLEGITPLN